MEIASRCAWTLYNFRRNLISRLEEAGFQVTATGAELDGFGSKLSGEGYRFQPAPVPLRGVSPVGDVALFAWFYRQFRRRRPEVVHAFTIKPVIYGTLAAALAGVPRRICTITGLGHAFTEGGALVNGVAQSLYRLALGQAHVVFFQNPEDRDLFVARRLVPAAKTQVLNGSGVDLTRFQQTPFRPDIEARPLRFLMLSRLLTEKGVMEYVEAAERLTDQRTGVEFRLVGARDTRNPTGLTAEQVERLQASCVEWLGAVEDVRPEIAASDVVVLPSYREGTPRSLLEAMAMGRPIITTDAPGCRQLVEPGVNGLLVPVRDPVALAEAMARLAADPGSAPAMGAAAHAFVRRSYDERAVIEKTISAYELEP